MATKQTQEQTNALHVAEKNAIVTSFKACEASLPTPAQRSIISLAPGQSVAPILVEYTIPEVIALFAKFSNILEIASAYTAMYNSKNGLTAQHVYSLSPFFWNKGEDQPSAAIIACVHSKKHGKMFANGLVSVLARAESGFDDHLVQLVGAKTAEGASTAESTQTVPKIGRDTIDPKKNPNTGKNGPLALALVSGFESIQSLPQFVTPTYARKASTSSTRARMNIGETVDIDLLAWLD